MTHSHLEAALQYLLGAGLIEEPTPLRFEPTTVGSELWQRTAPGYTQTRWFKLPDLLPESESAKWTLDSDDYAAAVRAYKDEVGTQ
jgi:hypothetical protein